MQPAPIPPNESLRIAAMDSFDLLFTPAEERFDRMARVAAHALQMPVALVTLVGAERQWFKSRVGLTLAETQRDISFCAHAILRDEPLIVPDLRADLRFYDNPLVTGPCALRFYAGVPLRLADGVNVGTLCVLDTRPRSLTEDELAVLIDLARLAESELQQDRREHRLVPERRLMALPQRASLLDSHTGCWNRAGFEWLLQGMAAMASGQQQSFALLMLALEGMEALQASLGDEASALVLLESAARLRRVVQGVGVVTSFAPDTFALMVFPCDRPALNRVQRRVRAVIQGRPFALGAGRQLELATCCGAAIVAGPGYDVALALVDADRRLVLARRRLKRS